MNLRSLVFAGLACAATAASGAVTWQNIQFGGFLSQGYLESTHNNYPVDTKDGTFDFREIGLNASRTFGAHLRVGGQIFAQKLGKYGDDKPFVDWAQLDYNFRPEFGVRVGRVKYPRSMNSEVLDLDVLRPFVFLPQSIYDARLRDFQASFDGGMVYGSLTAGHGSIDYKVFGGRLPLKPDSGIGDFFNDGGGMYAGGVTDLDMDSMYGVAVTWNTPISGLRFGTSASRINKMQSRGAFFAFPAASLSTTVDASFFNGFVEYASGPWTFAIEYLRSDNDSVIRFPVFVGPPLMLNSIQNDGYISVSRRVGSKFEVGAYYAETHRGATGHFAPPLTRTDWTGAVRYDVNDYVLVKLEVHYVSGEKDIFNVPEISNPPASRRELMMLFAAKTTFSF